MKNYLATNVNRAFTRGFSLLELLIVIAIVGLLMSFAIPSFSNMLAEGRISSQYNLYVGALYQTRSEAIKGAADHTVCAKTQGANTCGGASDWANGMIIFKDENANNSLDGASNIVTIIEAIKGENTVLAYGSTTNQLPSVAVSAIRYQQNGTTTLSTGSIVICDAARGPDASRALNISLTGDIRRGGVSGSSTSPRDAFNVPVNCPDPD